MKRLVYLLSIWAIAAPADANPLFYTYTQFDFPGANSTIVTSINDRGVLVGASSPSSEIDREFFSGQTGFIFRDGHFPRTLPVPAGGAGVTGFVANGVNNSVSSGSILGAGSGVVGTYSFVSGVPFGFSGFGGVPANPGNPPPPSSGGGNYTRLYGINNRGEIVGNTQSALGPYPIYWNGTSITRLNVPFGTHATAYGINDNGVIAGTACNDDYSACFGFEMNTAGDLINFLNNSTGTHFNSRVNSTQAFGINNSGDVVGTFGNDSGQHGFVNSGGQYSTVDVPNALVTEVLGINNEGQLVGWFVLGDGRLHGFVATPHGQSQNDPILPSAGGGG